MGYRYDKFAPGEIYHLWTRGVNHRTVFRGRTDYERFLNLLLYCLPKGNAQSYSIAQRSRHTVERVDSGEGLIDLLCYCLMTNHVHLLVKENVERGISQYMQRLLNSYARYFNVRHKRSGPLFTGRFQSALINADDQFTHVTRYIHLNPYAAHIVENVFDYPWSSLAEYGGNSSRSICHTDLLRSMLDKNEYRSFVQNEAEYAQSLADLQYVLLDYGD